MKQLLSILFSFFFVLPAFSQECEVLLTAIHGKYTGGCKKDKADGVGKSEGTDIYDGNFKSGFPSGTGTYTYKNGDYFIGAFKKGVKDGLGEFHYKKEGAADSVLKGFWKDDVYAGLYLKPYEFINKSAGFSRLEVKTDVGRPNTLTIVSENTVKMNSLMSNIPPPLPVIDQFIVQEGNYSREERSIVDKKSILILRDITYPFRIKAVYHTDSFEVIISKPGTWLIVSQIAARD